MQIRDNAQQIEIYNSGLLVFLYDEANRELINRANPGLLAGFAGEEDLQDERLKEVAQQRLLVVYELQQDDSLGIDVSVGPSLSETEKQSAAWLAPQIAESVCPVASYALNPMIHSNWVLKLPLIQVQFLRFH
ncbi:hypothetical protein [Leptolyngbya sp. FACHB-261]|uniref:hypothetical protein n=1 Tax=Leptolyngbya sp. FACHB-261 TaxID=2692806 RepID=UPI001687B72E|nr:hypothetical protein [Leptolyngbya sp. FACHB-261]MBD2099738.1 hypothetical protein [Leptolyngbya sp. FACHB-261]